MDIGTGSVLATAIYAGKDLIIRTLGPTADYWGKGLKGFNEKAVHNITRIFQRASQKISPSLENIGSVQLELQKKFSMKALIAKMKFW